MAFEHNDIVTVNRMNEAISEGGGGGGGLIFPTFTVDFDNNTGTCDMTFSEVQTAVEAGRCIAAKDSSSGSIYVLGYVDSSSIAFSQTFVNDDPSVRTFAVSMMSDGTIFAGRDVYPSTP